MIGFILLLTIPICIVGWAIYIVTGWFSPDAQRALGNFMHRATQIYLQIFVVAVAGAIIFFVAYVGMQETPKTATAHSVIKSQR